MLFIKEEFNIYIYFYIKYLFNCFDYFTKIINLAT